MNWAHTHIYTSQSKWLSCSCTISDSFADPLIDSLTHSLIWLIRMIVAVIAHCMVVSFVLLLFFSLMRHLSVRPVARSLRSFVYSFVRSMCSFGLLLWLLVIIFIMLLIKEVHVNDNDVMTSLCCCFVFCNPLLFFFFHFIFALHSRAVIIFAYLVITVVHIHM